MLTQEEKELAIEISNLLEKKDIENAIPKIEEIISISNNDKLKKQYSNLLVQLKNIKKYPNKRQEKEKEEFAIKVEKPTVTFKEVIGMDKLKEELARELRLMLNGREAVIKHKLKPSGLLLYGPPGVGKTFFLEALAGEFHMNMLKPDLGTLMSQWVGETEKNIKRLINIALKNQPCLIILDEVDSKLRNRASIEARGESVVTLNATTQFLETMQDIHSENIRVLFTGATNRIWDVDPAAKRPGRLGTLIYTPPPNLKERFMLFRHYLKTVDNLKIGPFGYFFLAMATAQYSPSDIEEICIQSKKEMVYKIINSKEAKEYETKTFTKEEYLKAKAEALILKKPPEVLSTKNVMEVIKKKFKNSSLDIWYVEAYKSMLGWTEIQKRTIKGRIFSKTTKEKIVHDGIITTDERKLYKDMLKNIKRVHRLWPFTILIRKISRIMVL